MAGGWYIEIHLPFHIGPIQSSGLVIIYRNYFDRLSYVFHIYYHIILN